MSLRVAVYARVSSDAQRKERTIDAQLRDVPAFCRARGWAVLEPYYVDDGKSAAAGKLAARDAFARLVYDAAAGRFDLVAVADLDRLTRTSRQRERGAILGAFQEAGVKIAVASTGQVLDFDTEEGDLLGSIGAWSAALENARRLKKTMAGKETTILRGGKPQGHTPYGLAYRKGDNERGILPAWSIDPARARVVVEIYTRVAAGESTATIARDLNLRGERRPRGGIWFDVQVRYVVTSTVYSGLAPVNHKRGRAVTVPPIVDAALAAEARAVLRDRYHKPPPRTRHHHLLTGLAACGSCGKPIGINSHTRPGERPTHYYLCLGRRYSTSPATHACALPMLRVDAVDARVWDALIDALGTDMVVERALGRSETTMDPGAIEQAEAEIKRLDALQDAALDQLARGVLAQATADRQVERLGRERKAATAALRAAQAAALGIRGAVDRREVTEAVRLMRADAEHMKPEERRELVRAASGRVSVGPDAIDIDLLIDAAPVALGEAACRSTDARPRIPAGRLTIATPTRRPRAA